MQPDEQETKALAGAQIGSLLVEGMPMSDACELAPEAHDLTDDYKPLREPVTLYRGFRRLMSPDPPSSEQAVLSSVQADTWSEQLRLSLANARRPPLVEKRLVCRRGHTLVWLAGSPWGHVPVAKTADGRFTLRGSGRLDGSPMTLDQWPAGEHLPPASCACHDAVVVSVHQAKSWFERVGGASPRDKFVYSP
jgi:hypothetical protein